MAMGYGLDSQDIEQIRRMVKQSVAENIDAAIKAMEERFQQMEERGTIGPQDVRMSCTSLALQHAGKFIDAGDALSMIDTLAQYVLTGKKPGAEG